MKKIFVIALFLPLILGCSQSPQDKSKSQFETGVEKLNELAFGDALESFRKSGASDLESPRGFYGQGLVFERKLLYLDALDIYMSITQSRPEFAEAHAGAGRMLMRLGLYDEAVLEAAAYFKYATDSKAAAVFWADALIAAEDPGRARREILKASDGNSLPAEMSLILARTFLSERQDDSAHAYLENAYSSFEASAAFYRRAADYFEIAGMIDSSMILSRLAIEASGNDFESLMLHFDRCLRTNYFYEARQVITGLSERGAGENVKRALQTTYFIATNERTRALKASEQLRIANVDMVHPVYYEIQANAALRNSMGIGQEVRFLRRFLEQKEYNLRFRAIVEYLLIMISSKLDLSRGILDDLKKLPRIMANKKEVALTNVHLLFDSGQREEAYRMLEELYRLHPTSADWLSGIGDEYLYNSKRHKEWKKAAEFYRLALDVNKSDRSAFTRMISMYRLVDRPQDALKAFDEYPGFVSEYAQIAILNSFCLVENGEIGAGVEQFKKNISPLRGNREAYKEMLSLLDLADKQAEALEIIEICLELNRNNVDMLVLAAEAFTERGQYDRAEELAEKAFALEPGNVFCSVQRAVAMYGQGKVDEAISLLEELYETNRFVSDVPYHLSRILSLEERDPLRAANLARQAVGGSYMAYQPWMNLCFTYYQGGRYDLARGEAIKASHKFKDRPLPFYWIGMTKYREGNQEAKEDFQKAIDLGLRNEKLAEARRILAQLSP